MKNKPENKEEKWKEDDSPYRTALANAMMFPLQAQMEKMDSEVFADNLLTVRLKVDKIVSELISQAEERGRADLKKSIREEIESRIYVFERPREDYFFEVYKHLKSKNEALDEILSLKSLK